MTPAPCTRPTESPEPVKVAVGTPDGLVTMLVTFGDADSQPAQVSCDWGGISKGLVRLRE